MANRYVATNGITSGDGNIGAPWTIFYAANGADGTVAPGDNIWIRGGTYTGSIFDLQTNGSVGSWITWRNYNHEDVVLIGNDVNEWALFLRGNYLVVWGLDVFHNAATAIDTGHVVMGGTGGTMINNYVHDGQAVGITTQQTLQSQVYGNVILFNGREQLAAEGPGYGIYAQNVLPGDKTKYIHDNIMPYNWSWGLQVLTAGGCVGSVNMQGNVVYNNTYFWKGGTQWAGQFISSQEGIATAGTYYNGQLLASNYMYLGSFLPGGGHYYSLFGAPIRNITATGNFFVAAGGGYALNIDSDAGTNTITGNLFVGLTAGVVGVYDTNSFADTWPGTRTTDIVVRQNLYEPKRANIVIFNWGSSSTVGVNPGTVLSSGDTYVVRDPLNWKGATVASGTWTSGNITVPMTGLTTASHFTGAPIMGSHAPHTAPFFAAFVLDGTQGTAAASAASNSIIIFG